MWPYLLVSVLHAVKRSGFCDVHSRAVAAWPHSHKGFFIGQNATVIIYRTSWKNTLLRRGGTNTRQKNPSPQKNKPFIYYYWRGIAKKVEDGQQQVKHLKQHHAGRQTSFDPHWRWEASHVGLDEVWFISPWCWKDWENPRCCCCRALCCRVFVALGRPGLGQSFILLTTRTSRHTYQ